MTRYYLVKDHRRLGPCTVEELANNGLERNSLVWREGLSAWMPAERVPELAELIATLPPPTPSTEAAEVAAHEEPPSPWLFEGMMIAFNLLFLSGMVAAGIAVVHYAIWLDAKANLEGVQPWQAFIHNPFKPRETSRALLQDYPRYLVELRRLNEASKMVWTVGLLSAVLLIPAAILFAVFLGMAWSLVQNDKVPTTPGAAAGLLFIPLFNFYWIFIALYELSGALNRATRRLGGDGGRVSPGLALATCVLIICLFIPLLCAVALVPATVVVVILLHQVKKASVRLARVRSAT